MKNLYSCLIILTFFTSCTNEDNSSQESNPASVRKGGIVTLPSNDANPYDNAGQLYDELFDAYYDGTIRSKDVTSVIADVETIANDNTSFGTLNDYQPLSAERIEYLAGRQNSDISAIIGTTGLSAIAKTSFGNFMITMVTLYSTETDAVKIYNAVVKYEETVIGNVLLSDNDQRVILTSTSIIRYSVYRAKKRPKKNTDPDWLIWVTHAFATEEGAEENTAKAIVQSLVTGIVSNK